MNQLCMRCGGPATASDMWWRCDACGLWVMRVRGGHAWFDKSGHRQNYVPDGCLLVLEWRE